MIYAPARERSHSPTGEGRGRGPRHGGYAAFLQNAGLFFREDSQGLHPGLVCDAHSGHGIANVGRLIPSLPSDHQTDKGGHRHGPAGGAYDEWPLGRRRCLVAADDEGGRKERNDRKTNDGREVHGWAGRASRILCGGPELT